MPNRTVEYHGGPTTPEERHRMSTNLPEFEVDEHGKRVPAGATPATESTNRATRGALVWITDHEPLRDAVTAYTEALLAHVPGMTDQTVGVNVKFTLRRWIAEAAQAPDTPGTQYVVGCGWGGGVPERVLPRSVMLALLDEVGGEHAWPGLDEDALGERALSLAGEAR